MLLALLPVFSLSFWAGGHIIVGRIAERMLTPEQADYFSDLFAQWPSENHFPAMPDITTWHDDLKANGMRLMQSWHFSDKPLLAPGFQLEKIPVTYNVTDAIYDSFNWLMDSTTTSNWAIQMGWRNLFHFVGDTHQPLHNIAFFSEKLPDGDLGGNKILLDCPYGSPCKNLHAMWDSILLSYQFNATTDDPEVFEANVTEILTEFPPELQSTQPDIVDPFIITEEAYQVGIKFTYGLLPQNDLLNLTKIPIDDTFLVPSRIAQKRLLSVGGYRLGRMMQRFYEARKDFIDSQMTRLPTSATISGREIAAWVIDAVLGAIVAAYVVVLMTRSKKRDFGEPMENIQV
jgi:hypothetical protein